MADPEAVPADVAASSLSWAVEREPKQAKEPYGGWKDRSAEDLMVALRLAGCSVRQVAEMTGFSREWVRRRLKNRGVLDSSKAPTGRVRPGPDGEVPWGYVVWVDGEEVPAWSCTILGIPAIRGMLRALEMFGPDAPRPLRESSPEFRLKGDERPSIAKLMSTEGWVISVAECEAALAAWAETRDDDVGLVDRMRGILTDGGWDSSDREVAERTREFVEFVGVLGRGAAGTGLMVL